MKTEKQIKNRIEQIRNELADICGSQAVDIMYIDSLKNSIATLEWVLKTEWAIVELLKKRSEIRKRQPKYEIPSSVKKLTINISNKIKDNEPRT